jgi:carbonic anhydrase/acetyltransferase-like protein (isoleucine patch superfamily)
MAMFSLDDKRVQLPASGRCWIAANATVVGDVVLEDEASIWFNSVVRGDNEPIRIGARSNVQDACVLHTDPGFPMLIGADCTIGHMVMLHGCRIGRGSLIGIGAIILNGAEIGEDCLIGAGALVPEGKVIPARSVVMGAPGKIIRPVSDGDVERIRSGAAAYQRKWQLYAAGMKPQAGS